MSENNFDFRTWMLSQSIPYPIHEIDSSHYNVETEFGISEINFYQFEEEQSEIVELRITSKISNTTTFFLHFQPVDESHSKDLFNEMLLSLTSLKDNKITKILLFCSAGMTTSFFAQKMNEVSNFLELDYEFNAVSVNEVYQNAKDYDVILIAPQVAYEENNIRNRIQDKLILKIPTSIFASYDANGCIEFIRDSLKEYHQNKKKKKEACSCCKKNGEGKFLVIATAPSESETRINYRIYDQGKVTLDQTVIKRYLDIEDLDDIIKVQFFQNKEKPFNAISVALPGVIQDGKLDLPHVHASRIYSKPNQLFDIQKHFEELTQVPVILENNANCAALGWYQSQEKYQNITLMSQPNGWLTGGQGIIVNGKLVRGAHGIAGEIKYIINQLQFSSPLNINPYHLDSIKEIVTKAILINISILDPEVIVLRCEMLPDTKEVHEELLKYLPEDKIPDIVHIDNFNDYILVGQQYLCHKAYKERKENE